VYPIKKRKTLREMMNNTKITSRWTRYFGAFLISPFPFNKSSEEDTRPMANT
jgi:hypothetical protein